MGDLLYTGLYNLLLNIMGVVLMLMKVESAQK